MEEIKPNYYAIIPAEIRYSTKLTPNAKLLYSEITALTNKEGYCWASNNYFAELYNTTPTSIINWLNQLEQNGFIEREIIYKDDTKQITDRYIKITNIPSKEILSRGSKEILTSPSKEILTHNNKDMNTINYNNNIYSEIVDYLNEKAGTHYRPNTNSTQRHIKARLNEKYTLDDFKTVIDKKVQEWKGTEFEQYLRPETLFGNKFESYLNAQIKSNSKKPIARDYSKEELNSLFTNLDDVVL